MMMACFSPARILARAKAAAPRALPWVIPRRALHESNYMDAPLPEPVLHEPFSRRLLDDRMAKPLEVADPEQALEPFLKSGSHVFIHSAAATPSALVVGMANLAASKNLTGEVTWRVYHEICCRSASAPLRVVL